MISDEVLWLRALDYGISHSGKNEAIDVISFVRAIEREAIAEPVRLMREWEDAKTELARHFADPAITSQQYQGMTERRFAAEKAIRDYLERMK